jgi:hypothetical protein
MDSISVPRLSHWNNQPAFQTLCNIVANDRLVCLTGAGISRTLKRKANSAKTLPTWWELLDELRGMFPASTSIDREDVDQLLMADAPGEWLIQAATILRRDQPEKFDDAVRKALEVVDGDTSPAHTAIAALNPRGIMTFNYDMGHENAMPPGDLGSWKTISPQNEQTMLDLMKSDFSTRFLLKAHGSLECGERLILDIESYRGLLVKSPTYRAFVGWLLTHFNLLIVGFGMSDPDFEEFLRLISVEIGGPVREHVLVTKASSQTPEQILLRRRYGIFTLQLGDWSEITKVLNDALIEPGERMREMMRDCTAQDISLRRRAHRSLMHLSVPGRRMVSNALRSQLTSAIANRDVRVASELIYSLGSLGRDPENKALLLQLLDSSNHREIVAHAALALDGMLEADDTATLERNLATHAPTPHSRVDHNFPDPDNRIPIYLAYLIAKNRRRAAETRPEISNVPMPFCVTVQPRLME